MDLIEKTMSYRRWDIYQNLGAKFSLASDEIVSITWSLVCKRCVSDCRYKLCQLFVVRHGIKKQCQTRQLSIRARITQCHGLASIHDPMSGVKKLMNIIPAITYPISANEASSVEVGMLPWALLRNLAANL